MCCSKCNIKITLTPSNLDFNGVTYSCPKCSSYCGLIYRNKSYYIEEILNIEWNRNLKDSALLFDKNSYFKECKTQKDIFILIT